MSKDKGLGAVHEAAESVSKSDRDEAVFVARTEGNLAGHAAGFAEGLAKGQGEGRAAAETVAAGQIATARIEGATAERERILGIESLGLQGHDKLIAEFKADGKTTPEQAAVKIIQAEKAKGGNILAALKADGEKGAASVPAAEPQAGAKSGATTPEGWKAEYVASADLQRIYPTEAIYVAHKKAEAAGRVHILDRKRA